MAEVNTKTNFNSESSFKLSKSQTSLSLYERNRREHFVFPRSPYTIVPKMALEYVATPRILNLSRPRIRKEYHIRLEFSNNETNTKNSGVYNKAALKAEASNRIVELSRPKVLYKGYQFAYPVEREITRAAKSANASERLQLLSLPKGASRSLGGL